MLGPVRFDYHVKDKRFQARIYTTGLYGIGLGSYKGTFNLKRSLQTGIMIFDHDGRIITSQGERTDGVALLSSIIINKNIQGSRYYPELVAHEVLHILQTESMIWANSLLSKVDINLKNRSKIYKGLSPYIYADLNGLTLIGLYHLQINLPWSCRYIEREADHFARRKDWPECP